MTANIHQHGQGDNVAGDKIVNNYAKLANNIGIVAQGGTVAVQNLYLGESNPYSDITSEELQEIRSLAIRILHGNFNETEIDSLPDRYRKPLADAIAHLGAIERSQGIRERKRINPDYRPFRSVIRPHEGV